jgi:hypothetical protein
MAGVDHPDHHHRHSGSPMSLAWSDPKVAVLQDEYTVSFTVDFAYGFDPVVLLAILGHPLAVLWWEMRKINSHWYLQGEDVSNY